MNTDTASPKVHHGRNVKRLREILGIKQEVLADKLELSQQTVSKLENKEEIDEETLGKIAEALNIPVDAIKNFSEQGVINIVASTFNNNSSINQNYYATFNPLDKVVELYERMIQEKNELIEKLLSK
ncbi:helix-turn-helix domain-containing protein [Apibacter sp. HY039]|uniref:helix-turn-helix domain-containing protein n=1 Tax=Apibacter sp. HY039 TaxID=2501476 RepID=UPI000FEB6040|nr:helix-turn-helix transcriptional regulator [Apibacter sp. HY039]